MIRLDNNQNLTMGNLHGMCFKYKDIDRNGQKNIHMQIVIIQRVEWNLWQIKQNSRQR